jgi:cytochrome bd ubiquinol oxidase subunit II
VTAVGIDLALVWAVIILFAVMMYVVMDGFDLGIGLLYPFVPRKEDRDTMMNSVAPVWDGNETWLALGGAGLLAAFPLAYAVVLSAFYLPIIVMLLGLILRGVAFEFRFKASDARRHWWDKAFSGGSAVATLCQGAILGAYIDGVPVVGRAYAGGALDWLTPFTAFTAFGLLVAYALLGCTWLILKCAGTLQARMVAIAKPLTWLVLAVIVVVSVVTPWSHVAIRERWFSLPNLFWFAPVPILVALAFWQLRRSLAGAPQLAPFLLTLCLVFLCYTGFGISLWPNVVPPSISIRAAAGPPASLGFALVGALLIIPMTLAYTAWGYYVFRGKVDPAHGYHE